MIQNTRQEKLVLVPFKICCKSQERYPTLRFQKTTVDAGKQLSPFIETAQHNPVEHTSCRLLITDKFLIDKGADVSVNPRNLLPKCQKQKWQLYAAKGSLIGSFGKFLLALGLGLRRQFCWSFIIAGVKSPIIGADFFYKFGLLVDVKSKRLLDATTHLSFLGNICSTEFPNMLNENPNFSVKKSTFYHTIVMTGPQLHAKPGRRTPAKLKQASLEF